MWKKQKDPQDGVTVMVSIEIWDSCSDLKIQLAHGRRGVKEA